jgi:hypothetical protein
MERHELARLADGVERGAAHVGDESTAGVVERAPELAQPEAERAATEEAVTLFQRIKAERIPTVAELVRKGWMIDQAQNYVETARRMGVGSLALQREAEGQMQLPGAERVGTGELVQRRAEEPLKPGVEQKPMDFGLFGDDAKQRELFQAGRASEPIAVTLTGTELGEHASFPELREAAYRYYEDNLVKPGIKVHNEDTGADIEFSSVGLRRSTRGGADLLRLIPALPDMLRKARWLGSEPDRRGRRNIKAMHVYASAAEIDGRRLDVILHVREQDDGTFHYSLHRDRDVADLGQSVAPEASRSSRPEGEGGESPPRLAAFEGASGELNITPEREAFQGVRGKFRPMEGETAISKGIGTTRSIVTLFRDANASTIIHEDGGHAFLEELMRDAVHPAAPDQLKADAATTLKWLGVEKAIDIGRRQHEKFARGFEQYLREGVAPSPQLANVFARFKQWLLSIYQTLKGLGAPINDEIRGVFDRMLSTEPQKTVIAPEQAQRPTLQDIHEADAGEMHVHPEHAEAAARLIKSASIMEAARDVSVLSQSSPATYVRNVFASRTDIYPRREMKVSVRQTRRTVCRTLTTIASPVYASALRKTPRAGAASG